MNDDDIMNDLGKLIQDELGEMVKQKSLGEVEELKRLIEEISSKENQKAREQAAYNKARKEFLKEHKAEFQTFIAQKKLQGDYYDE